MSSTLHEMRFSLDMDACSTTRELLQAYFQVLIKIGITPPVAADDFDESVFNSSEKQNIETMAKIENERGSQFIS